MTIRRIPLGVSTSHGTLDGYTAYKSGTDVLFNFYASGLDTTGVDVAVVLDGDDSSYTANLRRSARQSASEQVVTESVPQLVIEETANIEIAVEQSVEDSIGTHGNQWLVALSEFDPTDVRVTRVPSVTGERGDEVDVEADVTNPYDEPVDVVVQWEVGDLDISFAERVPPGGTTVRTDVDLDGEVVSAAGGSSGPSPLCGSVSSAEVPPP